MRTAMRGAVLALLVCSTIPIGFAIGRALSTPEPPRTVPAIQLGNDPALVDEPPTTDGPGVAVVPVPTIRPSTTTTVPAPAASDPVNAPTSGAPDPAPVP
ncbi:MAG: hypothetical protein ABJ314_18480, partial [Ilumatobacter sp.]